jgi:hypothetical protein
LDLKETLGLSQALGQIQKDFTEAIAHQACSLADIQHEMQISGTPFNTAFTFQKRSNVSDSAESAIQFEILTARDPSEYAVAVNIEATDSAIEAHFGYWTDHIADSQAEHIASTFDHVLNGIMQNVDQTIAEIDFFRLV